MESAVGEDGGGERASGRAREPPDRVQRAGLVLEEAGGADLPEAVDGGRHGGGDEAVAGEGRGHGRHRALLGERGGEGGGVVVGRTGGGFRFRSRGGRKVGGTRRVGAAARAGLLLFAVGASVRSSVFFGQLGFNFQHRKQSTLHI